MRHGPTRSGARRSGTRAASSSAPAIGRRRLEEALAAVRVQQAQHLRVDLGVVAGGALGERHLLVGGDVEQGVEDGVDAAVAVGWQGGHRCGPRCVPATGCATMAAGRRPASAESW